MFRKFIFFVLGTHLMATLVSNSYAQDIDVRGLLSTEVAIDKDGKLQKWDMVIKPELKVDFGDVGRLTTIVRARFDPADKLEPGKPDISNEYRFELSRRMFVGNYDELELRELYWDSYVGSVFLRLGKQQIVWGQADGLRVLDIVNPFNFREFILPKIEDRRIPLWTAMVEVPINAVTVQLLWIFDHTYDVIPTPDSAFAFSSPRFVLPLPQGFQGPVSFEEPNRPRKFVLDDDYGVRLTSFLGGWDLSLNYLYHYHDQALVVANVTQTGIKLTPGYERTHTFGGTFSNAMGPFTLRAELGYSTNRLYLDTNSNNSKGYVESGEFGYVLGLDYLYGDGLLVSAQIFQNIIEKSGTGLTRDQVDTIGSLFLEKKFRNETVIFSVLLLQSLNEGDGLLQADIEYQWLSNVIILLGLDVFYGDRLGLFGEFTEASRGTLALELGF